MSKIYHFFLGLLAGFGLCYFAMSQHVVHSSTGLHLVPKTAATLNDTYVDIRGFTAADAAQHLALGEAIARSGKAELQREFIGAVVQNLAEEFLGGGPDDGTGDRRP